MTRLLYEDFENTDLSEYDQEGGGSRTIVSSGARSGSKCLRIYRPAGTKRSEIRMYLYDNKQSLDLYFGFSYKIDSGNSNNDGEMFCQWHILPDEGQGWTRPDGFFKKSNGTYPEMSIYWGDGHDEGNSSGNDLGSALTKGQWYDFIVRYKFRTTSDGIIEVYRKAASDSTYVKVFTRNAVNCHNTDRGQFRLSAYSGDDYGSVSTTHYFDEVRVGTTFDDVKVGGTTEPEPEPEPTPGTASPLRVHCGSSSAYTDTNGRVWVADTYRQGGIVRSKTDAVANTSDDPLFQTYVNDNCSYSLPLANGSYRVYVRFADMFFNSIGERKFHVDANGVRVLSDIDVVALAGGGKTATQLAFDAEVTNGLLKLDFINSVDAALINAISCLPQ